ncbi:MAG: hypothetical protein ACRDL7_09155 [Gaiellaceae bacterium]
MFSFSSIDVPVRSALDANVRHFSKFVAFATAAVVIGVTLEAIGILHAILEWWKGKRRKKRDHEQIMELREVFPVGQLRQTSKSHSEEPKWVKRLLRIGIILVIGGVTGELIYGVKLENAHDDVHEDDLREIANTEGRLRQLQVFALARHISKPDALVEALKPFKDRRVLLRSYVGDAEGWLFCVSLLEAVRTAQMNATDQCAKWPFDAGKPITGLDISGPDADLIADAIVVKGRTTHGAVAEPGPAPLLVFVGVKNPFWFDEKDLVAPLKNKASPIRNEKKKR